MTNKKKLLNLQGVLKVFGETRAVHDLSLNIYQGEIFAILGPSGCGKTTTLRLIAGFESPDKGSIFADGELIAGEGFFLPPEKRKIGMVFQDYALFPHLTVKENLIFGLGDFPKEKRGMIVDNMLSFVGLEGYSNRYPNQLSGGQQQRVALARALAPCPVVILLDEPLSNLDADMRNRMRDDLLKILRDARTTAILVTHDQDEAFSMADRVAVLNKGKVEQVGTPEEIYHAPATKFVADFVGEADFIEGIVQGNMVETELGLLKLDRSLEEGLNVQVMIRPDDITFKEDEGGSGVVLDRQFKGEENLYHIGLPSGMIVHSSRASTFIVPVGSRVGISANPVHVVVFIGDRAVEG